MNAILNVLATAIGWVLTKLYGIFDNYGFAVIALTLIMRLCLIPIYAKQMKFSAKMGDMQSKVKEIQVRFAADSQRMNEEIQKLYSENGMSPFSGCLPMLIQMPIIFGLFQLLRMPLQYMTSPEMVVAVHEGFLWVNDLCQPDNWILPLLAGLSTYFTFSLGAESAGGAGNGMKYFYPVMIFLFGRSFPSGLALYWAVGNVFTIGQSLYFNKRRKKDMLRKEAEEEVLRRRRNN